MSAFSLSICDISLPHVSSLDDFILGDFVEEGAISGDDSWQTFTFDCILKAKELFFSLKNAELPTVWLLPAWAFQHKQKEAVTEAFDQLFSTPPELVFFLGSSGIDAAIQMAVEKEIEVANIIAIDGVYLPDANAEYCYYGVGGVVAQLEAVNTGWSQRFFRYETTIDFVQHDAFKALFQDVLEGASVPIDTIFSPGNGICKDGDIWLHNLQLLAQYLSDSVEYAFPVYTLGKVGAIGGVMNFYSLINNPNYSRQKHALIISQEQSIHQAVGAYVWINEEARR